jgi:uncharacterized protein YjbI with pentapeptide repeats
MKKIKSILGLCLIVIFTFLYGNVFALITTDVKKLRDTNVCKRCDLRHANLSKSDLSGANLSGSNLSGANLTVSDLSDANLSGANLSGSDLYGVNLSGSDLSGANLSGANLSGANLSGANLSGANLSGANLTGTSLEETNLSGANITGTSLEEKNLTEEQKEKQKKRLRDTNVCKRCDLRHADLSGVNLSGSDLSYSNLSGADLSYADLSYADLSNANLSNANLSNANLSKSNLSKSNLSKSNLSKSNLSGSDLSGSDLSGANLTGSIGIIESDTTKKEKKKNGQVSNPSPSGRMDNTMVKDEKKSETVKTLNNEELKIDEYKLLQLIYFLYIGSKHCFEVRKDYPSPYLDKSTLNLRKKISKIYEDYIKSKYSDVDTDEHWDEGNKMWNRYPPKLSIRSNYSKLGEAECKGLGFFYVPILKDKKYSHLFKHLFEDKVKKDF